MGVGGENSMGVGGKNPIGKTQCSQFTTKCHGKFHMGMLMGYFCKGIALLGTLWQMCVANTYIQHKLTAGDVYLVFDRCRDFSTKSCTRSGRATSAIRVHQLAGQHKSSNSFQRASPYQFQQTRSSLFLQFVKVLSKISNSIRTILKSTD